MYSVGEPSWSWIPRDHILACENSLLSPLRRWRRFARRLFLAKRPQWRRARRNGHVAAARKRSHQWCLHVTLLLKQLKEWHVIVFSDQVRRDLTSSSYTTGRNGSKILALECYTVNSRVYKVYWLIDWNGCFRRLTISKFRKRERISSLLVYVLHKMRN